MSNPPMFAVNALMRLTASYTFLSLYCTLLSNILSTKVPKLIMLKKDGSGREIKKRISDYLTFSMRSSPIDPDRSTKKMYSPLYWPKLDYIYLGGKKVRLMYPFPKMQIGFKKSCCSNVN